ncbi:class I SAM-dependent methyltransferase (plasmid) [Haloarcula salina]|uniref:class I SAM-dependent methyltransferase n=1 Tax=Haloarcula salina TaxID=1429914 RepID=UPI003C6EF307
MAIGGLLHDVTTRSVLTGLRNPDELYHFLRSVRFRRSDPTGRARRLQDAFRERSCRSALANLLGTSGREIQEYFDEFESDVKPHVESCRRVFDDKPFAIGGIEVEAPVLYAALRTARPESVVEIGVANGVSSYYALAALERNENGGTLTSIDRPKYEDDHTGEWEDSAGAWIPTGRDVGWIVPAEYRHRWEMQLGNMNDLLPVELDDREVDAFVYDGPKRYSVRKRAFERVAAGVDGCLYFCDDIAWNVSFERFAMENALRWDTYGNAGVAVGRESYATRR